jgi:hypothetical protein
MMNHFAFCLAYLQGRESRTNRGIMRSPRRVSWSESFRSDFGVSLASTAAVGVRETFDRFG